jgi:hypothetical protein
MPLRPKWLCTANFSKSILPKWIHMNLKPLLTSYKDTRIFVNRLEEMVVAKRKNKPIGSAAIFRAMGLYRCFKIELI